MATFNVFVEGPVDDSPMGLPELAEAMSQRYGLPAVELVTRLKRGRFRVKGNLDAKTAERYRQDLESIGARVVIEDSALSPTATPAAGVPVIRPSAVSLPPVNEPRTSALAPPDGGDSPPVAAIQPTATPPTVRIAGQAPRASTPPAVQAPNRATMFSAGLPETREPARPPTQSAMTRDMRASTPPAGVRTTPSRPSTAPNASRDSRPSTSPAAQPTPASGLAAARDGRPSTSPVARPTPASGLAAARDGRPSTSPAARDARPSAPPSALAGFGPREQPRPSTPPPEFASGLAAGFSDEPAADLGALGDDGALSLASLDGHDAASAAPQFDLAPPPAPVEPPAVKFAPPKPKPAALAKGEQRAKTPSKGPMDLFAPPDAGDQEMKVDLAVEEVAARAAKTASMPPANAAAPPVASSALPSMRRTQPTPMQGATALPSLEVPKGRFVLGVLVSLVVGFVPAHFTAAAREKTAFAEIDNSVNAAQSSADTMETYMALDSFREKAIDEKQSKRQMIALTSMLLWALIAAGVAYVWFRRIPWDRGNKPSS